MSYKMHLFLGDWSGDGHGKSEKILLHSNVPVLTVQDAYKAACKLTTVAFNTGNANYTGIDRPLQFRDHYAIGTYSENLKLQPEIIKLLATHGLDAKKVAIGADPDEVEVDTDGSILLSFDSFIALWIAFVKLADPSIELLRDSSADKIPSINGCWDKNLNVAFGYGLYDN